LQKSIVNQNVLKQNGTWTYSMYSKTVDVSNIAKKYGGGGHKGAAGFNMDKMGFEKG